MSEFTGLQPAGVAALLRRMNQDKATLPALVSAVRAGAGRAGPDLDDAARAADQILQRYLHLLDYWIRDLSWRLRFMQASEGSTWPGDRSMLGANLPYADLGQAQRDGGAAGKAAGERLRGMWEALSGLEGDQRHRALQQFRAELARTGVYQHEPHYAAALLRALGRKDFGRILSDAVAPGTGVDTNSAAGLNRLRASLGPLANMFATADAAGTLPADVRAEALRKNAPTLAAFLRVGNHTDAFAADAAKRILTTPRPTDPVNEPDWQAARLALLDELWRRPGVAQALLADPNLRPKLLDPDLFRLVAGGGRQADNPGHPIDHQYDLAAVLWRALGPTVGSETARQKVWAGIIRDRRLRGALPPDLAEALAGRLRRYFPHISGVQARESGHPVAAAGGPALPSHVTAADFGNFFSSLVRTNEGKTEVTKAVRDYLAARDPLKGIVFDDGEIDFKGGAPGPFDRALAEQAGILGAVFRGIRDADLRRDEEVDFIAGMLSWSYGFTPIGIPPVDTVTENLRKDIAEKLAHPGANPGLENALLAVYQQHLRQGLAAMRAEHVRRHGEENTPSPQKFQEWENHVMTTLRGMVFDAERRARSENLEIRSQP